MTKIIDGKGAILGRLASYVAKEALKGEEIIVLNCEEIRITGSKINLQKDFEIKRRRVGSSQKGPKHPRASYIVVKRTIRGMLPDHRKGRGREAFKRIKCYKGIPKEFEDKKKITSKKERKSKYILLKEIAK